MRINTRLLSHLVVLATVVASVASTNCDALKKEIADKLDAKGVKNYTLEVVTTAEVKDGMKVVGSCEAGARKIVYSRK